MAAEVAGSTSVDIKFSSLRKISGCLLTAELYKARRNEITCDLRECEHPSSGNRCNSTVGSDANSPSIFVLDCRDIDKFDAAHVKGSVSCALSPLLYKRLLKGTLSPVTAIMAKTGSFSQDYKKVRLVLIASDMPIIDGQSPPVPHLCLISQTASQPGHDQSHSLSLCTLLYQRLVEDGCNVAVLEDGFNSFVSSYPQLCEIKGRSTVHSLDNEANSSVTEALQRLSISTESLGTEDAQTVKYQCSQGNAHISAGITALPSDYKHGGKYCRHESPMRKQDMKSSQFPVEVIPYLFLGNEANAKDESTLRKNGITHVINVTQDLPNCFEDNPLFHYLRIPITDHWSQDLAAYFDKAIQFIDTARSQQQGVLVHCLAGISRSVTIIVAYLMFSRSLSLEDAYDYVKVLKENISPNFTFMGQLLEFQRKLGFVEDAPPTPTTSSGSDSVPPVTHPQTPIVA